MPAAYLDHAATTPMWPAAVEAMLPFLTERFANPAAAYRAGHDARRAVDDARDSIASVVGCQPGEVVFTSGGTEADNAAIAGAVWRRGGRPVCSAAEHHAVLHAVERHDGVAVAVDASAHVDLDALDAALLATPDAAVVSVMAVNNEVGTLTDLAAVAGIVRERAPQAVFHTDAVQAPSWLDLATIWPLVDVLSLSAHKFGGPKGVGVMVVRDAVLLAPLLVGGGQERERRSGTTNVAGVVATAAALDETVARRTSGLDAIVGRRDRLLDALTASIDGCVETVARGRVAGGHAHVLIERVESEALLFVLDRAGVEASAAAACAAGAIEPSHVLAAMGIDPTRSVGGLRLTLGLTATDADIDRAIDVIVDAVTTLRRRAVLFAPDRPFGPIGAQRKRREEVAP